MPNYVRVRDGNTYFFTVVTGRRQPILCLDKSVKILKEVVREVKDKFPFDMKAWVLLPDHIHCIWELPEGDTDYSMRLSLMKRKFTQRMQNKIEVKEPSASMRRKREGGIWQRRFWEHRIRDEKDYEAYCDYIHYNPVKHGVAQSPKDWEHSSFHRFLRLGIYEGNWCGRGVELQGGVGSE